MTIRSSSLRSSLPAAWGDSTAFGPDARRIVEQMENVRNERAEIGTRAAARGELLVALRSAAADGWNGPGTTAMSAATYMRGEDFLAALPQGFASPSIAAAPDGSVAMEWIGPARRSFSVQIDQGDEVSIAWVWGSDHGYAWTRFDDGIPAEILGRLQRTMA